MTKTTQSKPTSKPVRRSQVRAAFAARVRAANRGDIAAAEMKARPYDTAAARRYDKAVRAWRHTTHVFATIENRYYEQSGVIFGRYFV